MKNYLMRYIFLGLFIPTTCFAGLFSDNDPCDKNKDEAGTFWTKSTPRSQGNGWIWFLGKGKASSKAEAMLKAEGMALDRLVGECIFPHKSVKFNERCESVVDGDHFAYARASIKDKYCSFTKNADKKTRDKAIHTVLFDKYKEYKKNVLVYSAGSKFKCTSDTKENCKKLIDFNLDQDNKEKAQHYATLGCSFLDPYSCFVAGKIAKDEGDKPMARGLFKKACMNGHGKGCFVMGKIGKKTGNKEMSLKFFKFSCKAKFAPGCSVLGTMFEKENKPEKAKEFFSKACKLGMQIRCE